MKKFLSLLCAFLASSLAHAAVGDTFIVENLRYQITSEENHEVAITGGENFAIAGDIVIPESVEIEGTKYIVRSIPMFAFNYYQYITSVTIPNSVTEIDIFAFGNCTNLLSVKISDSVRRIGLGTFQNCINLKSVSIPKSLIDIDGRAFTGCSSLVEFIVEEECENFSGEDGVLFDKTKTLLIRFPVGKSGDYTIPASVTDLDTDAFRDCINLSTISIGDLVSEIGEEAFSGCNALESVIIGNAVTEIGKSAFQGCSQLESVVFGNAVRKIGEKAFYSCKISDIVLPESVLSIGDWAFAFCTNINSIKLPASLLSIGEFAFCYCSGITSITIPESVVEIGSTAFNCCYNLNEYIIDENNSKFCASDGILFNKDKTQLLRYPLNRLQTAYIPASVTSIGDNAFSQCKLESVEFPNSIVSIGEGAFFQCDGLSSITISDSIAEIGSAAFAECRNLIQFIVSERNDAFRAIDGVLFNMNLSQLVAYPISKAGSDYSIPDFVTEVCDYAFSMNRDLRSVSFPSSVVSIGNYVFHDSPRLEYVLLSDNISKIPKHAFHNCSSLSNVHWPAHLDSIGDNAFYSCNLTNVSLPEGTTYVGASAFSLCQKVNNLFFPSTLSNIEFGAFSFDNVDTEFIVTSTAEVPPAYFWGWDLYKIPPTVRVPAKSLEAYRNDPNWYQENVNLVPIDEISEPSSEGSSTGFAEVVDSSTDLSDTVVGDVYVTVGEEDGFDETDGSIVLNSFMDDEYVDAIGGMIPGLSDLANRFNGLVVQVPEGIGSVIINCLTMGSRLISVKIGEAEQQSFNQNDKGDISVNYDVPAPTFVYIFASDSDARESGTRYLSPAFRRPDETQHSSRTEAADNCVKIYSIAVSPKSDAITDIDAESEIESPIVDYFTIDGVKVDRPTRPGVYIIRRADGSTAKIRIS